MADGKKAAEQIDKELTGQERFSRLFRAFEYEFKVPLEPEGGKKQTGPRLAVKQRKNNFKEVSQGISASQAAHEAQRCLRCDVHTEAK
jgi:hypothetical protein